MTHRPRPCLTFTLAAALLAPAALAAPASLQVAPAAWHAPLPHDGRLDDLAAWWSQFDDPLLVRLVAAAQEAGPSVASARSRIEQARASRVAAGAALGPRVDASAGISRGKEDLTLPLATTAGHGLDASWEIDLFGGGRAAAGAAQARLDGARARWHDARVSTAAEVAGEYVALRACEARLAQARADADSRAETARLTDVAARNGFQSPANASLARASAAQGRAGVVAQQAQCDASVKALVALTALDEPALRADLAASTGRLPRPARIGVAQVPAQALAQRPDLWSAERDVVAAGADIARARADRLPRITLAGSIGGQRIDTAGGSLHGTVWRIGPLAISLPIFDGGTGRANVQAARARHEEAVVLYQARVRGAVREVETALLALHSTGARADDQRVAAAGYADAFRAADTRYRGGVAGGLELEEARRSDVQAQAALVDLERERVLAWISLYRALGGGWQADADPPMPGGG